MYGIYAIFWFSMVEKVRLSLSRAIIRIIVASIKLKGTCKCTIIVIKETTPCYPTMVAIKTFVGHLEDLMSMQEQCALVDNTGS